ncbi:unnamed protein product [Moneuplotes crassus]|uniref:Transmembrane protein n=1 Tax=Euplotes crassus TaxID=5936 RepID=A0AAD1Y596_EUPCR|nr:unnamed protein product [Moneuplotes crassus]
MASFKLICILLLLIIIGEAVAKPIFFPAESELSRLNRDLEGCLMFIGDLASLTWKSFKDLVTLNTSEWKDNVVWIGINMFMVLVNCFL